MKSQPVKRVFRNPPDGYPARRLAVFGKAAEITPAGREEFAEPLTPMQIVNRPRTENFHHQAGGEASSGTAMVRRHGYSFVSA